MDLNNIINLDEVRRRKNSVYGNDVLDRMTIIAKNYDSPRNLGGLSLEEFYQTFWGFVAELSMDVLEEFKDNKVTFAISSPFPLSKFIEEYRKILVSTERDDRDKAIFGDFSKGYFCNHITSALLAKGFRGDNLNLDYIAEDDDKEVVALFIGDKMSKETKDAYPEQRKKILELQSLFPDSGFKINEDFLPEECPPFSLQINPIYQVTDSDGSKVLFESIYSDDISPVAKVSLHFYDGKDIFIRTAANVEQKALFYFREMRE
jgi:hypothetical protein